ncbi:MAG TPA: NEW3 domain-containing protein, partial [Mycobacterium sp.]|nr:NEW3 domain-containing protein [Mycobacterium sp.]
VRAELHARGIEPSPQTRDMNPIYTGKDVSYIDTKQANRDAENAVLDGERFAVFAALLGGATYPQAALEKAWVQLVYGAHHDAITGSESDQVYIDLLTGWRDAWELGSAARDNALALISSAVDGTVVVWNTVAHKRTDVVTARLDDPLGEGVRVTDADGNEVAALVEHGGRSVTWLARDIPSMGWRAYHLSAGPAVPGWNEVDGDTIGNDRYRLTVDAARGGAVSSLLDDGRELLADGRVGNELAVYDEYPAHPDAGEGPWHLLPKGPVVASSGAAADSVQCYRCALGERLVVRGRIGSVLSYTQTLTLWRGVARVDCATTIDEFTGEDKLLRLRWPCPVPGAMPVSEVGDAVVGRGFALLHEAGSDESVDTAKHPHTLDNPAYSWFGLSSALRVRVGDDVRAVSVAEVIAPTESESAPLARDLMVALVRAGVTATCSSADRARYGNLDVDSNLPDARIALGGPDENAFTAAVLAEADPAYSEELKRQLYTSGSARVWVPAAAPLASSWLPGADLRGVRVLPVLVVAGGDDLSAAVTAMVDDLADAEIAVAQQVPSDIDPYEHRTVAVLNRGVPSFAVDIDGTLHTSLMRSCTGWPSGVWMDPQPRRTAPDGSNFQLQHWTHTFDYAVVSGAGDWRSAAVPRRSSEFSHPLLAVAGKPGATGGLPRWGSLLEVEPSGAVQLAALKAAGNPLASGSSRAVDPAEAIAVRLVETVGATTDVAITSGLHRVSSASRVDLLEEPRLQKHRAFEGIALHGYEIATLLTRLNMPQLLDADHTLLAPEVEAAQPLYARYWLHNRGPAPLGGLPAVAHLHPQATAADAGDEVVLRLTAASDCTDSVLHGTVRLVCPPGWTASPSSLPFVLPSGEHLEADVELTVPPDTAPGLYPIRAQLQVTGDDAVSMPASWRQVVEDVTTVSVGTPREDNEIVHLVGDPADIEVTAGEADRLVVTVGTAAGAGLAVEAHLISPWGTWEWIGPAAQGAVLTPGETTEIGFDVTPPAWVQPGQWWALVRIGCAGRLVYSPAVRVTVR